MEDKYRKSLELRRKIANFAFKFNAVALVASMGLCMYFGPYFLFTGLMFLIGVGFNYLIIKTVDKELSPTNLQAERRQDWLDKTGGK